MPLTAYQKRNIELKLKPPYSMWRLSNEPKKEEFLKINLEFLYYFFNDRSNSDCAKVAIPWRLIGALHE